MKLQTRINLPTTLPAILLVIFLSSACAPTPPATPFFPPKAATATPPLVRGDTPVIPTFTPLPVITATPSPIPPCDDGLAFLEDITIPDGSVVSPGASVDKRWLVQNNGSCNWDSRYRLKFVGGSEMGATIEQALYPARAGAQATIRISFTAPSEPGTYTTAWQAFNPDGTAFGDAVFMEIIVQPAAQVTIEVVE